MAKIQALGFGYIPKETKHHFLIVIPKNSNQKVAVYERFAWDDSEIQTSDMEYDALKVTIDRYKWNLVKDTIQRKFNNTLKEDNIVVGRFKPSQTPIDKLLGKELVLLLWAIEDFDSETIPTTVRGWLELSREERWWLYTMTNAATGHVDDKRGWRKAVKYALTENLTDDSL